MPVSTRSRSGDSATLVSGMPGFALSLAVVLMACRVDAQPTPAPAADPDVQNVAQGAADSSVAATDPRPFQDLDAADILN
jgi:hypothetical protein